MELISADLARAAATSAGTAAVVHAVTAFSADLFSALVRGNDANLVCSPYSVAAALGMTVQGAAGQTATQMLATLHSNQAADLASGLNGISQALSARSRTVPDPGGGTPARVELSAANALFGQRGVAWQQPFLDVLARDFGAGMRVVDYVAAAEASRSRINTWVAQQTRSRIPEVIPPGVLDAGTRLTLVNALYLKAPWAIPFLPELTRTGPFHRLDGSITQAQLMELPYGQRFAAGPGWVAAQLPYAGRELAMTVVVPGLGQFAAVRELISGRWLSRLLTGLRQTEVRVVLPRWTFRTRVGLGATLAGLGMPAAFTVGADFSAMTQQEQLQISAVQHEGYITVDEAGTEAAAVTAVIARAVSARIDGPEQVIADRPFLYLIHDLPTGTPLFVGQVLDPAAGDPPS